MGNDRFLEFLQIKKIKLKKLWLRWSGEAGAGDEDSDTKIFDDEVEKNELKTYVVNFKN